MKNSNVSMEDFRRIVGSKEGQLSGGQKQRIAIARSILRKPQILLVDEATSAIDTQSEALVQEAINKASQDLTAISIAHRLSILKEMNEILVFKNGVIIERGTFEELIGKKDYFYELNQKAT